MAQARLRAIVTAVSPAAAEGAAELWCKASADGQRPGDCPFAAACAIALALKSAPFSFKPATRDSKPQWLLDEVDGQMPTLRRGGEVVTDSADILRHIDSTYPGPQLCTVASDAAMEACSGLLGAVAQLITLGDKHDAAALGAQAAAVGAELAKIEELLAEGGPWLGGEQLCAADCALLPKLLHMRVAARHYAGFAPDADSLPRVCAYMEAGLSLDVVREATCPDEEILFGWSQEGAVSVQLASAAATSAAPPSYGDDSPGRYDFTARASAIDPRAAEHPEINFVFEDDDGEPADLEHASVDTRVPCEGKLVIWLMAHNAELFGATAARPPRGLCRG